MTESLDFNTYSSTSLKDSGLITAENLTEVLPKPDVESSGGFNLPPKLLIRPQVLDAKMIDLAIYARSEHAKSLCAEIVDRIELTPNLLKVRKRALKAADRGKLDRAIEAIVGSVLTSWSRGFASSRSMDGLRFSGEPIGYKTFKTAIGALEQTGFLYKRRGGLSKDTGRGIAARFWPTHSLLRLTASHAVDTETVRRDFGRTFASSGKVPKVRQPIMLKAVTRHPNERTGKPLKIDLDDPTVMRLWSQVMSLNEFVLAHSVTVYVASKWESKPPQWVRHFKGDFTLYGRLHAAGAGNYQSMPKVERLNSIRIDDEEVAELDLSSSHLSIEHGLLNLPLPAGDLYAVDGCSRDEAKAWINASMGKGSPVRRWAKDTLARKPELGGVDPQRIGAACMERYPFLQNPSQVVRGLDHLGTPERLLPHLLMGIEAEIMMATVMELQEKGIVALPVHDSLIVPKSARHAAEEALLRYGKQIAGVELRLKVSEG